MDALELLTTRRSTKNLAAPAPDELQIDSILQAATQVPDHGALTPWRFVVISSADGKTRYRQALADTVTTLNLGEQAMTKAMRVADMSPLTIAVIFSPNHTGEKRKPDWEQQASAACAAYAIQLAAKAQGFDSVWITGAWVHSPVMRAAFECSEAEKILALLEIGTATLSPDGCKNVEVDEFTTYW
ncbi:MAG: nitroreductase family protein [Neisseria sp.]|nr:nitroreductase family protein [Neisseria sp.]